ncbi:HET-domain-containing protein [Hypoxylon sp. FL1284]|nr:HET-domain-containing protein [Hypoxylon sp. FL1284]
MNFTYKSPHTCEYCRQITLDLKLSASDTQFSCRAQEALAAYQADCPLFLACFDNPRRSTRLKDGLKNGFADYGDLKYIVRYEKEELPYFTAVVTVNLLESAKLEDETEKANVLSSKRLLLWAGQDDAASAEITSRPYELDYNSPATVKFARSCVKSCQLDHAECRRSTGDEEDGPSPERIDPDSIPSRLVHLIIKDSELYVKLVGRDASSEIPKDDVSKQGYAILSYCWGGPQPVQLTHDGVGELVHGVPISRLPKSLRDAAWLTHEVGLNYVWIDALCILQDDPEDKVREISRMELYYSHSTVTICAALASRCVDGFLSTREEDGTDYSIGPVQLRCTTSTGSSGTVQALELADDFNQNRPLEPIATRGWTLQEALLSRRILIFSSRQLYFTCTVANASCGGLEPILSPRVMTSYESRIVGVHTLSGLRSYPIRNIWHVIVEEYSKRSLGVAADKFPAVAAMASSLVSMSKERQQTMVYLAGLMIDTSDPEKYAWRTEFLWTVNRMEETCYVPGRAPSWSWSSVDGSIRSWGWGWPDPDELSEIDEVELCEYAVEYENQTAPFGAIKAGHVKIRTRMQPLNSIAGLYHIISTYRTNANQQIDPDKTVLVLNPDTKEREEIIARGIRGDCDVFLAELIPFHERRVTPAGLIVIRAPESNDYVRVGMFEYQKPDTDQTASELALRKNLFGKLPFQEICMI